MIRAFELSGAGKHFASETSNQMIRLNPFRFLGEKSVVPFVKKNPQKNSIQRESAREFFRGAHLSRQTCSLAMICERVSQTIYFS